ncbi:MAG: glycosyltransferase family 4 protein [Tissierellia bacterium]|nr:glycosyltransferase family 4 protein [Tissierellia bacterium]
MRILHISAQLPTRTGSGVYYSSVMEEIDQLGGYVQGAIYGTQKPFIFKEPKIQYPIEFQTDEIDFPIVGMSDIMPYENTCYKDMTEDMIRCWKSAFRKRIQQAIKEFKPDCIFSHHLWILTSLVLEEARGIPVYGFGHGTDIRQAKQNPKMFHRHVKDLHRLKKVFALSNLHIPDLMELYGLEKEQIVVTGAGFSKEIFYEDDVQGEKDEILVVFAGKIAPSKGVYELVKAFDPISKNQRDVFLDIIGSGNFKAKKLLYDLQSKVNHVIIYNAEDQKSLGDFFRRADILVLPSFYEGLGLVALEALASGCRVVATQIDGLMELLGPNIEESGAIEYIPLPRIYDTDKPVKEDLPEFRRKLTKKLKLQIERVRNREQIPDNIKKQIDSHSWTNLTKRILKEVKEG